MVDAVRRPPGARAQVLALHGAQLPRGFRRLLPVAAVLRALGQGDRRPRDPRDSRFRDRGAAPLRTPHAPQPRVGAQGALPVLDGEGPPEAKPIFRGSAPQAPRAPAAVPRGGSGPGAAFEPPATA